MIKQEQIQTEKQQFNKTKIQSLVYDKQNFFVLMRGNKIKKNKKIICPICEQKKEAELFNYFLDDVGVCEVCYDCEINKNRGEV